MARFPTIVSVGLPILGLAGAVAFALVYVGPQRLCESVDGKWASAQSSCVTRTCFQSGTCGTWAYPAARCSNLKIGDARSEVHFQLGEPDEAFQGGAKWHAGKDSPQMIVATFSAERLQSLSCPSKQ